MIEDSYDIGIWHGMYYGQTGVKSFCPYDADSVEEEEYKKGFDDGYNYYLKELWS